MYNPSVASVQYTINPTAGVAMATRWALVMRGGKKPRVSESICAIADALIVVPFTKKVLSALNAPVTLAVPFTSNL
jgi:hypothetical protein